MVGHESDPDISREDMENHIWVVRVSLFVTYAEHIHPRYACHCRDATRCSVALAHDEQPHVLEQVQIEYVELLMHTQMVDIRTIRWLGSSYTCNG